MVKYRTNELDLNVDTAVPANLIINELLIHSLKYAFLKEKRDNQIEFEKYSATHFTLKISDNDIGKLVI